MQCSILAFKQAPALHLGKRDPCHQLKGKMGGKMGRSRRNEMERERGWRECSWRLSWSWKSPPMQGVVWNWKRFLDFVLFFCGKIWSIKLVYTLTLTLFSFSQVVQQLVEERLRVLQLTVFDHSLQELKDRMEKIDAATKQQKTVQHTLQVRFNIGPGCMCSHDCDTCL